MTEHELDEVAARLVADAVNAGRLPKAMPAESLARVAAMVRPVLTEATHAAS